MVDEVRISLQDYMNLVKKPTRGPGVRKYVALREEFEKKLGIPVSVLIPKVQTGDFKIYRRDSNY